jgi:hypothetical protein
MLKRKVDRDRTLRQGLYPARKKTLAVYEKVPTRLSHRPRQPLLLLLSKQVSRAARDGLLLFARYAAVAHVQDVS